MSDGNIERRVLRIEDKIDKILENQSSIAVTREQIRNIDRSMQGILEESVGREARLQQLELDNRVTQTLVQTIRRFAWTIITAVVGAAIAGVYKVGGSE